MLFLLKIEGYPASDELVSTSDVWVQMLWNAPRRDWHEAADTNCIRTAFTTLASTSYRWPVPARFWDALPSRPERTDPALPRRVFTLEERNENLRKLAALGKSLVSR